jgi:hypothetical protein
MDRRFAEMINLRKRQSIQYRVMATHLILRILAMSFQEKT